QLAGWMAVCRSNIVASDPPQPLPPMLITLLFIAAFYFTGLLVLAGAVWRAPEGFEDEQGFHTGRGPVGDEPRG
ncbi:MAG TPA: hypothetical protein VIO38_02985, partial [Rariglobus sp.]